MSDDLPAPPRPRAGALREIGIEVTPPKGTIYVWAPVPAGHDARPRSASRCSSGPPSWSRPGGAYGPSGEGFFRISLTIADERLSRGRRAHARSASRADPSRRPRIGRRWSAASARAVAASQLSAPAAGQGSSIRALASAPCASLCCRRSRARAGRADGAEGAAAHRRRGGGGRAGPAPRPAATRTTTSARARSRS